MKKRFLFPLMLLPMLGLMALACTSKEKKAFTEADWRAAVAATSKADLYAPNRSGDRFYAPWMEMGDKDFLDVLGWKLFGGSDYTREEEAYLPRVLPNTAERLARIRGNFILWIGHNTFLVRTGGRYWITDPMFSDRALVPSRKTPPAISLEDLNRLVPAPNIIISHNHYDHLDRASMEGLPRASKVFVPSGLTTYVNEMNKPHVTELNWWEERDLGSGVRLVCLPAQHWSLRIGLGRDKSLWAAFLLITPEATFFFGGDSGYFKGFREIGKKYPDIDFAFMATTAYHPRWFMHYQHMNVPEAVQAFEDLGAEFFIPTQWGTFHLGSEPAGYPGLDLKRHIREKELDPARFRIMDIGEILEF